MARFREPCHVCKGLSKSPCVICKQFIGKIRDMSDLEQIQYEAHKEHIEYLIKMYRWLKNCPNKRQSTGDPNTDEEIRKWIGEWRW